MLFWKVATVSNNFDAATWVFWEKCQVYNIQGRFSVSFVWWLLVEAKFLTSTSLCKRLKPYFKAAPIPNYLEDTLFWTPSVGYKKTTDRMVELNLQNPQPSNLNSSSNTTCHTVQFNAYSIGQIFVQIRPSMSEKQVHHQSRARGVCQSPNIKQKVTFNGKELLQYCYNEY